MNLMALIAVDIDHFKQINDRHGHAGGDRVLEQVARDLAEAFRGSDLLFRVGGEEFLLLLPMTRYSEAMIAAERLRSSLAARPISGRDGQAMAVTASLGVTEVDVLNEDWDAALHRADQALYQAKTRGRNRVVGYPPQEQAGEPAFKAEPERQSEPLQPAGVPSAHATSATDRSVAD
jgi:diguanylate cyclase (GGDEF)-like protein